MQRFLSAVSVSSSKAKILSRFFPALLVSYAVSVGSASAETFNVSNEAQLNTAVLNSADNAQDDVINLGGSTIELLGTIEIMAESGHTLSINNGTIQPAIETPPFRLLQIVGTNPTLGSSLSLNSMTFRNARHVIASDLTLADAGGAAVHSLDIPLIISGSTFTNNQIIGEGNVAGGAILVFGSSFVIDSSLFERNHATTMGTNTEASGGAISSFNGTRITITESIFNENFASRGGAIAAIRQGSRTRVSNSTFSNNEADTFGGAIWSRSSVQSELSTFYRNNAGTGGGALYNLPEDDESSGISEFLSNTLVENTGGTVGDALYLGAGTRLDLVGNLIISNPESTNTNCAEIGGSATEVFDGPIFGLQESNNISDDDSCATALVVDDGAELFTTGIPADNDGPTPTIALQPGSIAIDAGLRRSDSDCQEFDQRGVAVTDEFCDVGSFEFVPIPLDSDGDGANDDNDNCPTTPNPNQANDVSPGDGVGDACDDTDLDRVVDIDDNCPLISNPEEPTRFGPQQPNVDGDQFGDVCDDDIDNDGAPNGEDAFPSDNAESVDTDGDGVGNNGDNCSLIANPDQADANDNGIGDACEVQNDVQPVTVFQNINFTGNSLSVGAGDVSIGDLRASSVGNDRISSIEIADGYEVIACQDSGFRGRCEIFTDSVSDLSGINFNNFISSFRVRVASTFPVTVYRNVNFGGDSLSVGTGDVSIGDLRASSVGNDRISSFEIADGYEVIACQDSGFRGRCEIFTDTVSDLRSVNFNDFISSFRVRETSTSPVTVYRSANFGGNSLSLNAGEVSIGELRASTVGNDRISSIQIADGYEVFACRDSGFRGRCEIFEGNVLDLRDTNFNNAISSLRVQQQ